MKDLGACKSSQSGGFPGPVERLCGRWRLLHAGRWHSVRSQSWEKLITHSRRLFLDAHIAKAPHLIHRTPLRDSSPSGKAASWLFVKYEILSNTGVVHTDVLAYVCAVFNFFSLSVNMRWTDISTVAFLTLSRHERSRLMSSYKLKVELKANLTSRDFKDYHGITMEAKCKKNMISLLK